MFLHLSVILYRSMQLARECVTGGLVVSPGGLTRGVTGVCVQGGG